MAGSRGLYLRVGLLVVVGLALALGFVLFLTANRLRGTALVFETYIRESVQGLEAGSSVRYRGVAIGRVVSIGLVSAEYRRPEGEPFVGAFQRVLVRFAVEERRLGDVPSVQEAVKLGLRVRLATQGLTGVSYIELDFVSPERFPVEEVPWVPDFPYVPAIPSTVAQVQTAAETLLQRLQEVDLPQLVANFGGLLGDLRGELRDGELSQMLRGAIAVLESAQRAVDGAEVPRVSAELRGLIADLAATSGEARQAVAELRAVLTGREVRQTIGNLAAASGDLRGAAQRLPQSAASAEQGLRAARGVAVDVQAELGPLLRDLRATLANLRETTEALRRSPSQALFGAPPPAPREGR
jgi:ABC-type transporter Mla subunit MlaD